MITITVSEYNNNEEKYAPLKAKLEEIGIWGDVYEVTCQEDFSHGVAQIWLRDSEGRRYPDPNTGKPARSTAKW